MQLVVLGLNHKTAPVEVRECFSVSEEQIRSTLKHLHNYPEITECVLLSTCNRTEMYAVIEDEEHAFLMLQKLFYGMGADAREAEQHLFTYRQQGVIEHLFRVASGLDSQILGEGQILSQVKKAYSMARDIGTTRVVLNTLFHRAIAVGKKVRTETKIAYSAVSVSYAAVELAKKVLGNLAEAKVLLLGAGQMSELAARYLVANGVKAVFVSNRNYTRAVSLAEQFKGTAIPFEHFMERAVEADIVITSTGAPHYIVRAWDVAHLMPKRAGRPIVFIDIAVPRDVEPEAAAIAGVSLYNIDDLEGVVETNIGLREQEAENAEEIIETEVVELMDKFRYLPYRPVLAQLTDKAEKIRQREVKRALTKLSGLGEEEIKVLENMSRMLMRKLLRDPMVCINEAASIGKEQQYLKAVSALFKLEEIGEKRSETKTRHRHACQ